MIPGTVVYCFVGTTISNLSEAAGAGKEPLLIVSALSLFENPESLRSQKQERFLTLKHFPSRCVGVKKACLHIGEREKLSWHGGPLRTLLEPCLAISPKRLAQVTNSVLFLCLKIKKVCVLKGKNGFLL